MLPRKFAFLLFLATATAAVAQPRLPVSSPQGFEARVVAIMDAGGTVDAMRRRLAAVEADRSLTRDQRIAVDALQELVQSRRQARGLRLADAEAFATRHPNSPASAILVAEAALADGLPQRSADLLTALAPTAGALVQLVAPGTVSKLIGELDAQADEQRANALAKALLYAGWTRGSAGLRSYLALLAIRDELAAGRIDRAQALLPSVKSPAILHEILIDRRLDALRDDVERAGGPRLEKAWRDYLGSTRADWINRGDALSAVAYAEALRQANQHDVLVATFLSRFTEGYNCPTDSVARSIGDEVADSLTKLGRWAKAEDVMRRSGGIAPPLYAAMLLERGDFGRALPLFERSLKTVNRPVTPSNARALAWLQAARDCTSYRSNGQVSDGYDAMLLDVSARLFVLLCIDRAAQAKAALLAALADENERADALRWVQPFPEPAASSRFREDMNARIRTLQRDSDVRAAAARYGTILDWPLTSAVPSMAGMLAGKSPRGWQCGDEPALQIGEPIEE